MGYLYYGISNPKVIQGDAEKYPAAIELEKKSEEKNKVQQKIKLTCKLIIRVYMTPPYKLLKKLQFSLHSSMLLSCVLKIYCVLNNNAFKLFLNMWEEQLVDPPIQH